MKYPLHKNDTGSFQELAHASDVEFGQLSLLTIAPNCKRGGHYHKRKKEWFCCLHGSCLLVLTHADHERIIDLTEDSKEFVAVEPYVLHSVFNELPQVCELLVISSEVFDPGDMDTYRVGE